MICECCRKEIDRPICPYCGFANRKEEPSALGELFRAIFDPLPEEKPKKEKKPFDDFDYENAELYSDEEYDDDDDHDWEGHT